MQSRRHIVKSAAAACFGFLLAVSPFGNKADAAEPLKAVATFSILGDLVKQVGGDRVEVSTLVGPDADAHGYNPAPGDARKLTAANLVVVNGLGLEGWLDRLIKASGTKAPSSSPPRV